MHKGTRTKKINEFIRATTNSMIEVNTYKKEFDPTIIRYAEMRLQYDVLNDEWFENGCQITEDYTNKAGATNKRKTALYISLETLRKELLELENVLGLTPKGLKQIQSNGLKAKTVSALDKVLSHGI